MKQILNYQRDYALSYAEYGDAYGFPVLVQHGLIASIDDFALFKGLIRLGRRVICIARPGYGASSPYLLESFAAWGDVVAVLVEALQLGRFDVLGSSSGAPYGYALGWKFPKQVRNIYIFSGIPALYDKQVLAHWPYPSLNNASMAELEKLARELFFSNLSPEDLQSHDIRDSMMNDCFGVAQDLRLRFTDWGFDLSEVKQKVLMEHSREDTMVPFATAERTAALLPHCMFRIRESGDHFSEAALDEFIKAVMASDDLLT
jgi:pimeloyl-ACP methyl ester carboxylesterase